MNILALDTSTESCSVALWQDGRGEGRSVHAGQTHSSILLDMIDERLAAAGLSLARLDGIAYGEGPGAFTGLRIACAVVQGIAFAADIPVLGIGTLHAMAAGSGADRVICCLDARMQEVYHASFRRDGGNWLTLSEPRVCPPSAVPLPEGDGWLGCGSGFSAYGPALALRLGAALAGSRPQAHPDALDIARLAAPLFRAGRGRPAECASPVYIRDKVALKTAER